MNAPTSIVPPYKHTPLFPLGKDSTPYRKIADAGPDTVKVETVRGMGYREVTTVIAPMTEMERTV